MRTKSWIVAWACALGIGTIGGPANAKDSDIGKHDSETVKEFCEGTEGGTYLEGNGIYGCKWVRDKGAYAVICDQESCFYTTPYRRKAHDARTGLADVASGKLDGGGSEVPWPWLGLAAVTGIAGFAVGRTARRRPGAK